MCPEFKLTAEECRDLFDDGSGNSSEFLTHCFHRPDIGIGDRSSSEGVGSCQYVCDASKDYTVLSQCEDLCKSKLPSPVCSCCQEVENSRAVQGITGQYRVLQGSFPAHLPSYIDFQVLHFWLVPNIPYSGGPNLEETHVCGLGLDAVYLLCILHIILSCLQLRDFFILVLPLPPPISWPCLNTVLILSEHW